MVNRHDLVQDRKILVGAALTTAVFLAFVYLLTYSGIPHNPDERLYIDSALWGDVREIGRPGWFFSLLLLPFLKFVDLLPNTGGFQMAVLVNNLIVGATAAILTVLVYELSRNLNLAVFTSLAYGLGTLAWPYSRYLFREPLVGLLLLLLTWCFVRLLRRPNLLLAVSALVVYGLVLLTKSKLIGLLPVVFAATVLVLATWIADEPRSFRFLPASLRDWVSHWVGRGRRLPFAYQVLGFVVYIAVSFTVLAFLSWKIPDVVPDFIAEGPDFVRFVAMWISPGWGLLVYVPLIFVSLLGLPAFIRQYPGVAMFAFGGLLFYFLLASRYPLWWGWWGFGPRQFVPFLPWLMLPFPWGWRWMGATLGRIGKFLAAGLLGLSVLIQLVGVLVPFNQYFFEQIMTKGITGDGITWDWSQWPIAGMARFFSPATIDLAWLWSADGAGLSPRWPVILPLAAGVAVSALLLMVAVRSGSAASTGTHRSAGVQILGLTLLLGAAWAILAGYGVQAVYLDAHYRPEMGYAAAAETIRAAGRPNDILVMDLWTENLDEPSMAMLNYCKAGCPKRLDILRPELKPGWQTERQADLQGYERAWLVLTSVPEGDPNSVVEQWLGSLGYLQSCEWTGPQVRLCLFDLGQGEPVTVGSTRTRFGEAIRLSQIEVKQTPATPDVGTGQGDRLQIQLNWQTDATLSANYTLSVQVVGPDGSLFQAFDWPPGNGFRPTTSWQPGETIVDRRAIEFSPDAPPGVYQVFVILYNAATGERLAVQTEDGSIVSGDALPIYRYESGNTVP
jgi:hypothetical protein